MPVRYLPGVCGCGCMWVCGGVYVCLSPGIFFLNKWQKDNILYTLFCTWLFHLVFPGACPISAHPELSRSSEGLNILDCRACCISKAVFYWWTLGLFPVFSIINNVVMNIFVNTSGHLSVNTAVKTFLETELLDQSFSAFWILVWQEPLTKSACHLSPLQCCLHTTPRLAVSHTHPVTSLPKKCTFGLVFSARSTRFPFLSVAQRRPTSWHQPSFLASSLTSLPPTTHSWSYPHALSGSSVFSCCLLCLDYCSHPLLPVASVHHSSPSSMKPSPRPPLGSHRTWHTMTNTHFSLRAQFFVDVSSESLRIPSFLCP